MSEPAPDIGSVLRQARIRRGQSLDVVQQQTRIPKKMIDALETNRFEEFPAVVYLRGFLKSYCDHLELDFDPLWAQIDPNKPKPAPPAPAPEPEAPAEQEEPGSRLVPAILAAGLLVAAGAVYLLSRKPVAPAQMRPEPPAELAPLQATKELSLRVVARRDAWLQLETDGNLRFQGRAPTGFSQVWEAKDGFLLRTKDPSALTVYLDGKELPLSDALKTSAGDYKIMR
ncbi:MAG: DUF4115 domain-containing protein [Elusimicrobia bacterium]|nr:DUF4115 domain-containing protein [Elusimicrobiota bacterium]